MSFISRIFKQNKRPSSDLPPFPKTMIDRDCTPKHLADGTFGSVYLVTKHGKPAVIKAIPCKTEQELNLARKECAVMRSAASCKHAVKYYANEVVPTKNGHTLFIFQEYLTTFESRYDPQKMTEAEIIQLGIDLCSAMIEFKNLGFYHLDIQPKNIFIDKDNHFKLGDFGSATYLSELNTPQPLRGTPAYMAPEVFSDRCYSEQSELYTLGILLYSLVNRGRLPFSDSLDKEHAIEHRLLRNPIPFPNTKNISLALCLHKACEPFPEHRFSSLEEMLNDLNHALQTGSAIAADIPIGTGCPPQMFDADAFTEPCASLQPQMFDADAFAATCAIMPPQMFDADTFAATCAIMPPQMFDADAYASSCAIMSSPTLPSPALQNVSPIPQMTQVQFSAIAPQTAIKGEYTLVQLFMYEAAFRSIVEEVLAEAETPMIRKNSGMLRIGNGVQVKVVLSSPDVQIEDNENEQTWYGDYLVFDFAFELPFDFKKRQILLKASVYFDDVPATKLLLTLKTASNQTQTIDIQRQDVRKAYMSYAREDQARVGSLVQGMRRVRPDLDIFFDVFSLRCGENWEESLYQNLEQCDTLFLCWSRSAKNSIWVEKEWRYMLVHKGSDSIEPLPIEPPELCPPPEELNTKYFNDNLLYMIRPIDDW